MEAHFSTKDLETVEAINEVAQKYNVPGADVLVEANRMAQEQKEDLTDEWIPESEALTSEQIIDKAGAKVAELHEKEREELKEGLPDHVFQKHADSYGYEPLEFGKEFAGNEKIVTSMGEVNKKELEYMQFTGASTAGQDLSCNLEMER